jgi:hypothetical protein
MAGIIIGAVIALVGAGTLGYAIRQAVYDVDPETIRRNREENLKKLGF